MAHREGFFITGLKGFHIGFPNGYTISVQFGPGNYSSNYDRKIGREEEQCGKDGSMTAETAYWGPNGELIAESGEDGDSVQGYQTVQQVFDRMTRIAAFPKVEK